MNGLLKKVKWRGWLNRSSRVHLETGRSTPDAASNPAHLPNKAQRLLTPKKARREFNNEIRRLAKDGVITNYRRRVWLRNAIILALSAWIAYREAFR